MRLLKHYLFTLALLAGWLPLTAHDIHISYGEARAGEGEFSGRVSFYKDDFLKALANRLGGGREGNFVQLAGEYLQEHFTVTASRNGQLSLTITEFGEDGASIWFRFKFSCGEKTASLTIRHTALLEEFSDQMNLLTVHAGEDSRSLIFSKSSPEKTLEF